MAVPICPVISSLVILSSSSWKKWRKYVKLKIFLWVDDTLSFYNRKRLNDFTVEIQFKIMAGWHTVSSLLWLHKTLILNQNHKKTYFIRHRLCHFLSTKYTILYGMHKSALTLGQIHLPLTNGPSVKCVNKKTFCFFIRIQWDLVKFYYT